VVLDELTLDESMIDRHADFEVGEEKVDLEWRLVWKVVITIVAIVGLD